MTNCLSDADDEAALHPTAIYLLPSSRAQREGLTTRGEFSSRGEGGIDSLRSGLSPQPCGLPICTRFVRYVVALTRNRFAIALRAPHLQSLRSFRRTRGALLGHTRFPVVHIRPHCHLS